MKMVNIMAVSRESSRSLERFVIFLAAGTVAAPFDAVEMDDDVGATTA